MIELNTIHNFDAITFLEQLYEDNDIVVDCVAGSGTTAIVCKNTDRNYIVNDMEYKYVKIMKNRLN